MPCGVLDAVLNIQGKNSKPGEPGYPGEPG